MVYKWTSKKIINNFVEAHTDEIEAAIRSALSEEKSINEIKAGDHFEYKGIEWVCLDVRNKTAFVVTAKVIANMPFNDKYEDGCNNWRTSSLRKWLNGEFLDKNFDKGALLANFSTLTADNGDDKYGVVEDYVTLIDCDQYRKYRNFMPKYDDWVMTPLDYSDYLEQCETLEYNIHDTMIALPHDFWTMHNRLTQIINYEHDELVLQNFTKRLAECVCLEFLADGLLVRQPHSLKEIEDEGRILSHCVGGYAERHAMGKLSIMFLRKVSEPNKPYYTVEVSQYGGIVQCRGYRNNVVQNGGEDKPQEIKDFEQKYQRYLDRVFAEKRKERKTA